MEFKLSLDPITLYSRLWTLTLQLNESWDEWRLIINDPVNGYYASRLTPRTVYDIATAILSAGPNADIDFGPANPLFPDYPIEPTYWE